MRTNNRLISFVLCSVILIITLAGCLNEKKESKSGSVNKNNNILILLDLSDRILTQGQIDRDKQIINRVFKEFKRNIRSNLYFNSKDKFEIAIARQELNPNSHEMNVLLDSFFIDMEQIAVQDKKSIKSKSITANLDKLYELAYYSTEHNDYKGADIVGYLRDDLSSFRKEADIYRNRIVVVTDGYLYVDSAHGGKDDWPSVTDLKGDDIAMVELRPLNYKSGELQDMKSRLHKWLSNMNGGNILLKHSTNMTTVLSSLDLFLRPVERKDQTKEVAKKKTEIPIIDSPTEDLVGAQNTLELITWYADTDGDGYIDLEDTKESIEQPYGYLDRDNPIDDCPNERGSACTNGCLDNNSNCISDKEEVRSIDSDDDTSESYVSDEKYSDVKHSESVIQSNDVKEESRSQESVPLKVYTWFLDQDDDEKGDPATVKETNDGNPPVGGNWVKNSEDQCPTRKASNFEDGCPELQILMVTDLASVSSSVTITAFLPDSKSADEFEWSSNELKFSVQKGKDTDVTSDYVGKFRLVLDVFNPTDKFASSATERIAFTVSNARLSSELQALAEYGNTGKTGRTKSILDDKAKSLDFIHNSILNKDIPLIKLVKGEKVSYTYRKFENEIMGVKRVVSTYINSINVVAIEYDSNSGKIESFTFQQL